MGKIFTALYFSKFDTKSLKWTIMGASTLDRVHWNSSAIQIAKQESLETFLIEGWGIYNR